MRLFLRNVNRIWKKLSLKAKVTATLIIFSTSLIALAAVVLRRDPDNRGLPFILLLVAATADLLALLQALFIDLLPPETQRKWLKDLRRWLFVNPIHRSRSIAGVLSFGLVVAALSYLVVSGRWVGVSEIRIGRLAALELDDHRILQSLVLITASGIFVFLVANRILARLFVRPKPKEYLQEVFVGRRDEEDAFVELLQTLGQPPYALCVFGLPGVGKSALLRRFRRIAANKGIRVLPRRAAFETVGAQTLSLFLKEVLDIVVDQDAARTDPTSTILRGVLDELLAAPSVLLIDTTKDFRDVNGLESALLFLTRAMQAENIQSLIVTVTREKIDVNGTAPVRSLHLDGFDTDSDITDLITRKGWSQELLAHARTLRIKTGGNPQVIEWICSNRRVAQDFIQNPGEVRVDSIEEVKDLLNGIWAEATDLERNAIAALAVASRLSPKCEVALCRYLVGNWDSVVSPLMRKGLVLGYDAGTNYSIHDLLQDFAYDRATPKDSIHNRLGDYYLANIRSRAQILALHHYTIAGNVNGAIQAYDRATSSLKRVGDYSRLDRIVSELNRIIEPANQFKVQLLKDKALSLLMLARPDAALKVYADARSIHQQASTTEDADILWGIAESYRLKDEYKESLSYFQQAESLFQTQSDTRGMAESVWGAAESLRMLGKQHEAVEYFVKAKTLSEAAGSPLGQVRALTGLASAYRRLYEYQRAMSIYEQALRLVEENKNDYEKAWILRSMGQLYRMTSRFDVAEEKFRQAHVIFQQVNHEIGETWAVIGFADSIRMMSRHNEALQNYVTARDLSQRTGDRSGEASSLLGMAEVYRAERDYMRSITHAEDAQKVFVATGREEETIHCQLSMAETHRLLGKVNLSQYNAIYERYEKVDSRWGKIHTLIGQALALQHQQQPAGDVLRRAKEMAQWSNLETEIQFISRIENSQPNEEVHLLNFP